VQVTGLPGGASVVGPVEQTLSVNGMLVKAGLFDDPFYFDLQGFRETRSTGTLRFNNQRDFFAGQNDTEWSSKSPAPWWSAKATS
jgi:hypothetical protein